MVEDGEKSIIGKPIIENASITAEVVEHTRDKKIIVFKKWSKNNARKKAGHRQLRTVLKILKISLN